MFENLNPPTEPELVNADWIRPGRSSWDWFAGDKANWKGWLDFAAEMGWEYHLVDEIGFRGSKVDFFDRLPPGNGLVAAHRPALEANRHRIVLPRVAHNGNTQVRDEVCC
jgi:hypothetical protein